MKALVFDKSKSDWDTSRGFELAEVSKPELNREDRESVIVKVEYAGVCGTDRGLWHRQVFREQVLSTIDAEDKDYRIFGHELYGEVAAAGANVEKKYGIKVGDKVSADSHVVCNECFQCRNGQKNVCTNEVILGVTRDGVFAEYVKIPAHDIWKNDVSKIRPEVAAVQDPFGNAMHAASKVDLKDKTVAIHGVGAIGQFLVLIAQAMGAKKVIGIEPSPVSQEVARKLGIDELIPLTAKEGQKPYQHDPELTDKIKKLTGGLGVDVSFEMSGYNSALNNAIFSTRRGGDVILFGLKNADFVIENYNKFIFNGLTLHGVIGRQIWRTWEQTKNILEDEQNGVQDKIFEIILNKGEGNVIPIGEFEPKMFEEKMKKYPKLIIKF